MARRNPRRIALVAVTLIALVAVARADLDVGVPPGTPLDWVAAQPRRIPTGSVRIPTGVEPKKEEPGGPRTVERVSSVPRTTVGSSDVGQVSAMAYARILTLDIGRHLPFVGKRPEVQPIPGGKKTPGKTATGPAGHAGKDGPDVEATYPPPVPDDLYWMGLAVLLRKLIHPELVSDAESVHDLVSMGEASLVPCAAAEGQRAVAPWIEAVRAEVRGFPAVRPHALTGATLQESVMLRLAAEDLTSGYPTGLGGDFAARLLALEPEETVPLVVRYLEDCDHTFLRRNACSVLGDYIGDVPNKALEKAFTEEKDGVVRVRALEALARRRYTAIVPKLEKAAEKPGLLRPLALWALGAIGDPKASKTIAKALARRDDPDVLWSAIPAAARCRHDDPAETIAALKKLAKFLADAPPGTWEEAPNYPPDVRDEKLLRVRCLLELTVIALARLGDDAAKKQLEKMSSEQPIGADPGQWKATPLASKETIGTLHAPSLVLFVETLPSLGDWGKARLEKVATDQVCELVLRLQALDEMAGEKLLTQTFLENLVDHEASAPVRARALRLLAAIAPASARKKALLILRSLADGSLREGPEVLAAVEVFEKTEGKMPVKTLGRALKNASESADKPGKPDPLSGDRVIKARLPLVEEILKALGGSKREEAVKILLAHAREKKNPARAEAVAALGGFASASAALVGFLDDDDGWVRLVAWRALARRAPSLDAFADWIWGAADERSKAVAKWKLWLAEQKPAEPPKPAEPAKPAEPKPAEPAKPEPAKPDEPKKDPKAEPKKPEPKKEDDDPDGDG